jgi:hypothetical protein
VGSVRVCFRPILLKNSIRDRSQFLHQTACELTSRWDSAQGESTASRGGLLFKALSPRISLSTSALMAQNFPFTSEKGVFQQYRPEASIGELMLIA